MDIKIVIGANFGDEGKGLMTDYFSSKAKSLVIRANGGPQAGHTVVRNGIRHVFGHFGAGTLNEADTFLSKNFIINPMLYRKEALELHQKNITKRMYFDNRCLVTTPYDMILNQLIERKRGDNRHGSCGVGINETIQRSKDGEYIIRAIDFYNLKELRNKLIKIRDNYISQRIEELNLNSEDDNLIDIIKKDEMLEAYLEDVKYFCSNNVNIKGGETKKLFASYERIVFEGAQGLMLDEGYKFFPNVTHSKTGIVNPIEEIIEAGIQNEDIEVIYVTRCYMTRHGAGEFPTEVSQRPYKNIVDKTNIPNEFQGSLRFGIVDINDLAHNINEDFEKKNGVRIKKSLAVTCLDQIDNGMVKWTENNEHIGGNIRTFMRKIKNTINPISMYLSYGEESNNIIKI